MLKINWDVVVVVFIGILCIAVLAFFLTMLTDISAREKKCIDNEIHHLFTDKYWKGTGFPCKPLSSEETLDA
jgi:hypothetical protein